MHKQFNPHKQSLRIGAEPDRLEWLALDNLKKQWWENRVSPLELSSKGYPEDYVEEYIRYITIHILGDYD